MKTFKRLGYRQMKQGFWGKPIGFTLIAIEVKEDKIIISQRFMGNNNKSKVWSSREIDLDEELECNIAYYESWHVKNDIGNYTDCEKRETQGFLTMQEVMGDWL